MPISLSLPALNSAAQSAQSVSKRDAISPAASMAFLSHSNGALHVKATDMDNWLSLSVQAGGKGEMEAIQVDAFKFADLVGKLNGDTVSVSVKDGYLHLASGKSKRKLAGVVTTYPELPKINAKAHSLDVGAFREAIAFAVPSIASPDKPTFQGVRVQDGNAVAYNGSGMVAGAAGYSGDAVTLSPETIKLIKSLPEDGVTIAVGERLIEFAWGSGVLTAKKMEGDWPFLNSGIGKIMPAHDCHLAVSPSDLLTAISAVKAVAADDMVSKSKMVTLDLSKNGVEVSVSSHSGSATEPVDAEWDGDPLRANFSVSRLEAILRGFKQDMPVAIGISALGAVGEVVKGCVIRQDAKPGFVGMLAQIR